MKISTVLFISIVLLFSSISLFSQTDPYVPFEDIERDIDRALDYFSIGDYETALSILEKVLSMDPLNPRAADLKASIRELYAMESSTTDQEINSEIEETEKPDFSLNKPEVEENPDAEDVEKPDFSVRDEGEDILQPKDTRSVLEVSISPNLVFPWDVGEEFVVFPEESGYSAGLRADGNYFFKGWNRIFGFSATYSLFLLDYEEEGFASSFLHVIDGMLSFRTFFLETVDSKIVFKLSLGYRGYFSNGYNFYGIERSFLNGFNMGVNLEAPLIYLFWEREFWKKLVFDVDINLLFFPDMNTLNLFDFRVSTEYKLEHFSVGVHFGAYSVITPEKSEYIMMTGMSLNFYL